MQRPEKSLQGNCHCSFLTQKQMSVTEISQKEGKNPKTIQTQLYRAKNMLKKMLAERSD